MKILVAASGGVAALKTPTLLRRLRDAGHEVKVLATDDAYQFITPLSLAIAAGGEVFDRKTWFQPDGQARHIKSARWADVLVVAPATADAIASAAYGRGDDVISATILAGVPEVVWVPAMNDQMWQHPLVKENVTRLKALGHHILGPISGELAALGEGHGVGRMLEPEDITAALPALFKKDLQGLHVAVSAGPTREYLDPVRFISNPSSGKMGYAVAEAARDRGAKVTLVSGPTSLPTPLHIDFHRIESAEEMLGALEAVFDDIDILVMTAAVADWRAADIKQEKQAKMGQTQQLTLQRTPDILSTLAPRKRLDQVVVGFAMETHQGVARAADKARRKRMDFICLNYPRRDGSSFGGDTNEITLVRPEGEHEALARMSKRDIGELILTLAHSTLEQSRQTSSPDV